MKTEEGIKCQICGKRIPEAEIESISISHTPETALTYEETKYRCKMCAQVYGHAVSEQIGTLHP